MIGKPSQKEILVDLLRRYGRVTLGMMAANGILYTARNRIGDLKKEGWIIEHYNHDPRKGETVSDNAYILKSEQAQFNQDSTGQYVFI